MLTFSYTVGAGQDIGDLAVTSFNLNGATLQDAAGNSASLSGAVTNPAGTLQIDTTAPAVTSVATSGPGIDGGGNGDLNAGDVVTLTVNLSEAVTVAGGTPTLSLNNGGTASYSGGSGSGALTFSYTVGAGQDTGDLAVTSFNLNGATLQDAAGNSASLSGAVTNPAGTLQIDTTAPAVTSVVTSGLRHRRRRQRRPECRRCRHADGQPERGGDGCGGTPTLSLNNGGTASYSGGSGSGALTFSYTVGAGQDIGDLAVTSFNLNGATLQDAAGNSASLSGAVTNPAGTLQIDTTAPAVAVGRNFRPRDRRRRQRRPSAGACRALTADLSEAVTVAGGTPTLSLKQWRHGELQRWLRTGVLTFSYTVGAGQDIGDLAVTSFNPNGATLQDAAGNSASLSGAVTNPAGTLQIDTTAPTVTSVATSGSGIDGGGNGDLNAGHVVTLTVNLSEAVAVGGRHADAVAEQWRHGELQRWLRSTALSFSYTVGCRAGHRRPGGDVVQPERGNAAGCGRQQRQPLGRGDQPGRHLADRHHGADGDVGRNFRPRHRRQRQRRPECRPCRHPDGQPE